jgi:hypothetical protein
MREAIKCPCGCQSWLVSPEADVQGVEFTEIQAKAIVALLDALDGAYAEGYSKKFFEQVEK